MTTVNTSDEKILSDDLLQDILVEGKKVKVYGKIGGLINLGRTFFTSLNEVEEKRVWAEAQMVQKYGAEIYGNSAQLGTQHSNGTASDTGRGSAVTSGGSLISCRVSTLMDLSQLNESSGDYDSLKKTFVAFMDYCNGMDDDWKKTHNTKEFEKVFGAFRQGTGPTGEDNVRAWKQLEQLLAKDPWKADIKNDTKFRKYMQKIRDAWEAWGGSASHGQSGNSSHLGGGSLPKNTEWTPEQALRIDVTTNFNEEWYKRKFKSGLLNKIIFAIKTDARSHSSPDAKTQWTDHKYTADEMLPQDKRKLDSLQWKMTNKVAKDFISLILGWSRKKEKKIEDGKEIPANKLQQDTGFGSKMAGKALSNRGILGRLKQKIFAGGQSNNVISVAFQLADPNDGWKLIEEKEEPEEGAEGSEGSEGAEDTEGKETGKDTGKDTGDTEGKEGKEGASPEKPDAGAKPAKPVSEHNEDPFESGLGLDHERARMILEACGNGNVDELVDTCIQEI